MESNPRRALRLWNLARWPLIAAIGPIAFGSTYWVTREFLPADSPLWGSAIRALPAGLVLLLVVRRLPRGMWWWRSVVLGTLNMGLFFCLVYVAAQLLPSSVAASVTSVAPLMIAAFAWLILRERPTARVLLGAVVGAAGVLLIVGTATGRLDIWGIAASLASMVMSALGAILMKRWNDGTPVLTITAWQLLVGGIELTVVAVLVEGAPPSVTPTEFAAFAYISLIATALGFFCWFSGFRHLPAGVVGVIGLLNPVTGVALGVLISGETLGPFQLLGIGLVLGSILLVNVRRRATGFSVPVRLRSDRSPTPSSSDRDRRVRRPSP
ncbi:DMT family transporter [Microbacterium murale]|uniref:ABC transporter permease n=1 Tax=Microbacterium murale TaxID=1081040 RepID=A0ABQ1RZT9_9MICO|nr:EamA family transporter [Microbacterium murale]GGD87862.1 ABC transporter permease [Microbacterium murale]